jgi:hypothetical protein
VEVQDDEMSYDALLSDGKSRPDLFAWFGAIGDDRLRAWLRGHALVGTIPDDLFALWSLTGGGDYLETETLLGPFGDPALGDDVIGANEFLRAKGLPAHFLVFSRGIALGAIDLSSGDYVELADSGFRVTRRFSSLDAWYLSAGRAELRDRYGLR